MKRQNIQLWRGIACLMVFVIHFGQRMGFEGQAREITEFGAYGVQVFFIVSGFLIANSCESYARQDTLRYIVKRIIKLLPLYYGVLLYYYLVHRFVLGDIPQDPTGWGWLRYLLCLNSIVPPANLYFWDNLGITWTIPNFVWMYACLPVVLKYVRSFWGAAVLLLLSVLGLGSVWVFGGSLKILYNVPFFLEGVLIFYGIKDGRKLLAGVCFACLLLQQCMISGDRYLIWSCVFCLLILATDGMQTNNALVNRLLSISDRYSYTFYLVHGIVFIHVLDGLLVRQPVAGWLAYLGSGYRIQFVRGVIGILGSVVLTWAVNRFWEVPIQRWLSRKADALFSHKKVLVDKIRKIG